LLCGLCRGKISGSLKLFFKFLATQTCLILRQSRFVVSMENRYILPLARTQARIFSMSFATTPATVLNPWLQILSSLEKKVIRQSFETWLKPTRFSHIAGRTLYVRVPSPEFQHIGDKYADLIQEAIDLQGLDLDDVSFVTTEEDPSIPPQRRDGGFAPVPAHARATGSAAEELRLVFGRATQSALHL
jgi:hypothetical protein